MSDSLRDRILSCTDVATLDIWLQRAALVSSAAAVVRTPRDRSRPARPTTTARARKKRQG